MEICACRCMYMCIYCICVRAHVRVYLYLFSSLPFLKESLSTIIESLRREGISSYVAITLDREKLLLQLYIYI